MTRFRASWMVGAWLLTLGISGAARGEPQPLAFVRGLQGKGYGDVAVEYLQSLEKSGRMPEDVADVFDLEMSKSLRIAAKEAYDLKQADEMKTRALKHLDKFLKEKPDHNDTPAATASGGGFAMDEARLLLALAQAESDKTKKEEWLARARAKLEDARPRFVKAIQIFEARLKKAVAARNQATKTKSGRRTVETRASRQEAARIAQMEIDWIDSQFQLGLTFYHGAQTYSDPKAPQRATALKTAADVFDSLWQAYRVNENGDVSRIGITAHMWHGKVMEELGDYVTAGDIYDEVLANAEPGVGQRSTGMEPLFAQVAYFRFLIYKRKATPADFIAEARSWLYQYRNYSKTDGYQGVALENAKAMLEAAKTGNDRKMAGEARDVLVAISKVRSSFQGDAIKLLRGGASAAGPTANPEDVKTFDEALTFGNSAAQSEQWGGAVALYERAQVLAEDPGAGRRPTKEQLAQLADALVRSRYFLARELVGKDKYAEALPVVAKVIRESRESALAPAAAEVGVKAAFGVLISAPADKKEEERKKLMEIAKFTIDNWPSKPEADGVRILMGQLSFADKKIDEAIKIYEEVNPNSERYPLALHWAGHTYWVRYLLGKHGAVKTTKEQLAADLDKAFQRLSESLKRQQEAREKEKEKTPGIPPQMVETYLSLAEVRSARGEAKEAAELYQPVIDQIRDSKPKELDTTTQRAFTGAVSAYLALSDIPKASAVGMLLAEIGEDNPQVNGVLMSFASTLDRERGRLEQTAVRPSADPKEAAEAKARIPGVREMLAKLLQKVATRQQLRPGAMVFIADTCGALDLTDEARKQYRQFLDRVEKDEEFRKEGGKYVARAQTQLAGLLRKEGKFDEALVQVNNLIEQYPRALSPLVARASILQAQAEKDPAKYEEAVAEWTSLRGKLQAGSQLKKPPEYYEVVLHLGECLVAQAQALEASDKTASATKAKQAEQLLKSTLTLSPTLGGKPSMVPDYELLIEKAIVLQGRTPEKKAQPAAAS